MHEKAWAFQPLLSTELAPRREAVGTLQDLGSSHLQASSQWPETEGEDKAYAEKTLH